MRDRPALVLRRTKMTKHEMATYIAEHSPSVMFCGLTVEQAYREAMRDTKASLERRYSRMHTSEFAANVIAATGPHA